MMALAARTDTDRQWATQRIAERLTGRNGAGEDRLVVQAAYQCALLILGQQQDAPQVAVMLGRPELPVRRPEQQPELLQQELRPERRASPGRQQQERPASPEQPWPSGSSNQQRMQPRTSIRTTELPSSTTPFVLVP